jgi:two-component system cell cycle sensor histidine kinase/response regulator CckA
MTHALLLIRAIPYGAILRLSLKKPSDPPENWDSLRKKIIGLGERSFRKSYYPELQQRLADLERFRALLDQSNDAIFLLEVPSGRFLDENNFTARRLHYSPEEISRMTIFDLVESAAASRLKTIFSTGQAGGSGQETITTSFRSLEGDEVPMEMTVRPVLFADTLYAVAVAREITERKQLEAQLMQAQKMEAVARLAGGVAHDFNNLLTAILGNCEMLLQDLPENDPRRLYAAEIIETVERASTLTRELLAFGRKQITQPRVINLNELISGMEKMVRHILGEEIELILVLDPALAAVKVDPGQMDQVIMNLAVNARDAMPQGGLLTVETENVFLDEAYARDHLEVVPGPYVMLVVSDNGIGMDAATQAHVFEPFFTTKEPSKGSGLGLSMVFGIVKQSGGHISFNSEPRRGTTFKIFLPQVEEAPMPLHPEAPSAASLQGTETILVVEDDEQLRSMICRTLRSYGYTVLEARHGSEAILVCGHYLGPIHLVLTDVVMPGLSGPELMERLAPLGRKMKVLFMSGYTEDTAILQNLMSAGAPFLEKPFKPLALAQKVRQVLDSP